MKVLPSTVTHLDALAAILEDGSSLEMRLDGRIPLTLTREGSTFTLRYTVETPMTIIITHKGSWQLVAVLDGTAVDLSQAGVTLLDSVLEAMNKTGLMRCALYLARGAKVA